MNNLGYAAFEGWMKEKVSSLESGLGEELKEIEEFWEYASNGSLMNDICSNYLDMGYCFG